MSRIKFLLDEHVNPALLRGLTQRDADIVVWRIGSPGAPALGTLDPEILHWCERNGFVLVTNNRASMPVHLTDHLLAGRHIPGIFILNAKFSIGDHVDELEYIWSVAQPDEFVDIIWYLPIKR